MAAAGTVATSILTGGEFSGDERTRVEPDGFFRKGVVGGWRDEWEFPERHDFDAAAGDMLVELGYEHDHDWVGSGRARPHWKEVFGAPNGKDAAPCGVAYRPERHTREGGLKSMARRRIEVEIPVLNRPSQFERGTADYRGYVGADSNYDFLSAIQFNVLFALGMLETHKVLDLGCGSLRVGRLLIPYLQEGNYYGIEPNKWLVDEGIAHNVGDDLVALRKPTFRYVDDFSVAEFGVPFDFIVANSIFSHTYRDLARESLPKVAAGLADKGLFALTFVEYDRYDTRHHDKAKADDGSGWLYPGDAQLHLARLSRGDARRAEYAVVRFDWFHPAQTWVLAGHLRHADWVAAVAERGALAGGEVSPRRDDRVRQTPSERRPPPPRRTPPAASSPNTGARQSCLPRDRTYVPLTWQSVRGPCAAQPGAMGCRISSRAPAQRCHARELVAHVDARVVAPHDEAPVLAAQVPLVESEVVLLLGFVRRVLEHRHAARLHDLDDLADGGGRVVAVVERVAGVGEIEHVLAELRRELLRVALLGPHRGLDAGPAEDSLVFVAERVDGGVLDRATGQLLADAADQTGAHVDHLDRGPRAALTSSASGT